MLLSNRKLTAILVPKAGCFCNKYLEVWRWLWNLRRYGGLREFEEHGRESLNRLEKAFSRNLDYNLLLLRAQKEHVIGN